MGKYKMLVKGIVSYEDKYLIVERWFDDRIVDPYQWGFIDENLEFGESPDKGVLRIVEENSGLITTIDKILYTWSFMVGDICNIGIAYSLLAFNDTVLLSEELNAYKWVNREEINEYVENESVLHDIEKAEL